MDRIASVTNDYTDGTETK